MRMTVSRTALCLAVLMTGCQSPSLRERWFKNPFAANKPQTPEPNQPQVAAQQPAAQPMNNPAGTQTASVTLQPMSPQNPSPQQPTLPSPTTKPAPSPIIQTSGTMPQQSARLGGSNNERIRSELERGESALRTKRYTEAKMAFENALSIDPQNLPAHHRLGQVHDMQQRFGDAERHYLNALSLQPNNPDVLSDLGYSYVLQGRFEDAIEKLNRALSLDPNHKTAVLNLGAAYAGMGDPDRARAYFRRVVPEDKANELLTNELQRSINRNRALVRQGGAPDAELKNMSADELQRVMSQIHDEQSAAQERLDYLRSLQEKLEVSRRESAVQRLQFEAAQKGNMPSWRDRANGIPEDQLNSRMQNLNRGDASQWGSGPNDGQSSFNQPPQFPQNNGSGNNAQWNGGNANNFNGSGLSGGSQPNGFNRSGMNGNGFNGANSGSQGGMNFSQPNMNSNGFAPGFNGSSGNAGGGFDFNGSSFPPGAPQFPSGSNNSYNDFGGMNAPTQPNLLQPTGPQSFGTPPSFGSGFGASNGFGPGSGLPNQSSFGGQTNFGGAMPNMLPDANSFGSSMPNGFGSGPNMTAPNSFGGTSGGGFSANNLGASGFGSNGSMPSFNPAEGFGAPLLNSSGPSNGFVSNGMPNVPGPAPSMTPGAWTPGSRGGFGSSSGSSMPSSNTIQHSGGPYNNVGDPGVKQLMEATQLGMGAGPGSLFNLSEGNRQLPSGMPSTPPGMGISGNGIPLGTPSMGTPSLSSGSSAPAFDPNRFRQMPTWGGAGR